MNFLFAMTLLSGLAVTGALAGCASSAESNGKLAFGPDGSIHPDLTAPEADYTGQGREGEGWAGNSDGEGGPSAVQPTPREQPPP